VRDLWRRTRREGLDATTTLLCVWAVFVLAFFSFSGTKLPHYLLYGFTPLAVLTGAWLARCDRRHIAVALVFVMCAVLVLATLFSPDVAVAIGSRQKDVFWHALTQRSALPAAPALAWAVAAGAAIAGAALIALRRPLWGWVACGGCALATSLWFNAQVVPWWGQTLQGPVRALALDAAARGVPLVQWRVNQPSAAFYRNAPTLKRAPLPGEAALTRVDRMDAPGEDRPPGLTVLRQERGLALVAPAR
jgi:4-amino-4-deoxy-L-arabinose transferase-like glycosyltransferase